MALEAPPAQEKLSGVTLTPPPFPDTITNRPPTRATTRAMLPRAIIRIATGRLAPEAAPGGE
jgi:hypothetical protein